MFRGVVYLPLQRLRASLLAMAAAGHRRRRRGAGPWARWPAPPDRSRLSCRSKNFTSFLSRRIGRAADAAPSVKLNVAPQRPTDAAILRAISDIEQRRSAGEKRRMEQAPPAAHSSPTSYARKKRGPFDPMKAASDMAGITQIVLDALRAEMGADGSGAPAGGSRRGASSDGAAEFVEFARQGDGPQVARRGKPPAELRFARRGWRSNSSIRSAFPDDGLARSGGSRALPRPRQLLRTR